MKRIARIVGVDAERSRPASPLLAGISTSLAALAVGLVAVGCFESATDVTGETGSETVITETESAEASGSATFTFENHPDVARFGPDAGTELHFGHEEIAEGVLRQTDGNVFIMDPGSGAIDGFLSPEKVAEFKTQVDPTLKSDRELAPEHRVLLEEIVSGESTLLRLHPAPPPDHVEKRMVAERKKVKAYMRQRGLTEMRVGDQVIELKEKDATP